MKNSVRTGCLTNFLQALIVFPFIKQILLFALFILCSPFFFFVFDRVVLMERRPAPIGSPENEADTLGVLGGLTGSMSHHWQQSIDHFQRAYYEDALALATRIRKFVVENESVLGKEEHLKDLAEQSKQQYLEAVIILESCAKHKLSFRDCVQSTFGFNQTIPSDLLDKFRSDKLP